MEGSIHEDTTTTDYDSGDSEGVSYAYESGRPVMNPKPVPPKALAASPKRRTNKSRSPKGVRAQTQPQFQSQSQPSTQAHPHCQCPCAAAAAAAAAASAASSHGSQLQVSPVPSDKGDDPDNDEDQVSTEFEEDTDVEREAASPGVAGIGTSTSTGTFLSAPLVPGNMSAEHRPRSRPRRRLSGAAAEASSSSSSSRVVTEEAPRRSNSKKATPSSSSKKGSVSGAGRRRTPYIEEYPSDEARRPMVLLKEHKLPRRFSASDAKNLVTASSAAPVVEEPASVGTCTGASRGRSPPGRRLHGPKDLSSSSPSTQKTHKKHRYEFQEAPGGKFSGSDMDSDSDFSSPEALEASPVRALEPSPRRHSREPRPSATATAGVLETNVMRSSAWPEGQQQKQAQYSSSWPLQSGSHYPQPRPVRVAAGDGYDSEDESDDVGQQRQAHQQHTRQDGLQQHVVGGNNYSNSTNNNNSTSHHHGHHHNTATSTPRAEPSRRPSHSRPHPHQQQHTHPHSHSHARSSPQNHPHPHHQQIPSRVPEHHPHQPGPSRIPEQPRDRDPRPRARPPRPIVARTVISQRSMAFTTSQDTNPLCEIWRGRPEDWESPYSSSDNDSGSESGDDLDGERIPPRMLLEGGMARGVSMSRSGRARPREGSRRPVMGMALSLSRRERSVSRRRQNRAGGGAPNTASGFLRRSDAAQHQLQLHATAWERCASPEDLGFDHDGHYPGVVGRGPARAVSRARSRWTMVAYGHHHHPDGDVEPEPEPELPMPVMRRWTFDVAGPSQHRDRERSRSRGREQYPSPPVFSARRTREFLSPKPRRAADRFDFEAWGQRGSTSMLALGLGLA